MNAASIFILLLVILAAVAAIASIRKPRKEPSCRCGCEGCSLRDLCRK